MNDAFEAGFFSDKLWSVAIYSDWDTTALFDHSCQESDLPSIEDFHQVSIGNVQLLLKVCSCLTIIALVIHLSTFKFIRIHILNNIVLILAHIAIGLLTVVNLLITLFKSICDFIV